MARVNPVNVHCDMHRTEDEEQTCHGEHWLVGFGRFLIAEKHPDGEAEHKNRESIENAFDDGGDDRYSVERRAVNSFRHLAFVRLGGVRKVKNAMPGG